MLDGDYRPCFALLINNKNLNYVNTNYRQRKKLFSSRTFCLFLWFSIWIYCISNKFVISLRCNSCHGECFRKEYCNCNTGMCEGEYCFTETWGGAGHIQMVLYKGCGKGRHRIGGSNSKCDAQRLQDRLFCTCHDSDFCNNQEPFPAVSYNNVTCLHCSGGACDNRCDIGDYCLADFVHSRFTCVYGRPTLPFHYQSFELQQTNKQPLPSCAAFRAGPHHRVEECACTNPICNNPDNLREQLQFDYSSSQFLHCHSCAEEVLSETVLPSCKRQICVGQYCVVKAESVFDTMAGISGGGGGLSVGSSSGSSVSTSYRYKQWSGCLNTTRPDQVLKGTFQRWTVASRQVTECICQRDFCNLDVKTCMRVSGADGDQRRHTYVFFCFLLISLSWCLRR